MAQFAQGRLVGGAWDELNVNRAWTVVMRAALAAFYSHPWAWNEIGFGGPAYPRGFMRLGGPGGPSGCGSPSRNPAPPTRTRYESSDREPDGDVLAGHPQRCDRARDNDSRYLLDVHSRDLPGEATMARYQDDDEVDLVIVGAGAGGSVLAQRLARARLAGGDPRGGPVLAPR